MAEINISENIKSQIETAKMNAKFMESENKPVIIIGKDNIDALWQEFGELFVYNRDIQSYKDVKKREFVFTLCNSKKTNSENKEYDRVLETFVDHIPNPAVKEIIDSYINQRPSMLFSILDENDEETINQIYLTEKTSSDNFTALFPTNNILYNEKSINFINDLIKKHSIPEDGSWDCEINSIEEEINETYLNFNLAMDALSFVN